MSGEASNRYDSLFSLFIKMIEVTNFFCWMFYWTFTHANITFVHSVATINLGHTSNIVKITVDDTNHQSSFEENELRGQCGS